MRFTLLGGKDAADAVAKADAEALALRVRTHFDGVAVLEELARDAVGKLDRVRATPRELEHRTIRVGSLVAQRAVKIVQSTEWRIVRDR